jgi:hypothetical protein
MLRPSRRCGGLTVISLPQDRLAFLAAVSVAASVRVVVVALVFFGRS